MSSPTSTPASPHELEGRNGPIFIGFTIDCLLFGLLIAQICMYLRGRKWHRDGPIMQGLVYFLSSIELFRLVVVIQSVWGLLIELRARPGGVVISTPLAVALPSLAGFESAIVQCFFAWRIWSMRRGERIYCTVVTIIVMITVIQTAGSVGLSYYLSEAAAQVLNPKGVPGASLFATIWLVGNFVCDLFIVFAMAAILINVRKEATFRETEKLISYILRLTVETGALTVLAAAVMLGLTLRYPRETYFLGILYILGGLYTNIFLYLLNSRKKSRKPYNNEINLHLADTPPVTHSISISQLPEGDDLASRGRGSKG